ncbi:MAG: DUF4129 domain-containing transglutaminase family protein [Polyangiales bacterium]
MTGARLGAWRLGEAARPPAPAGPLPNAAPEPWLSTVLRSLVHALCAAAWAYPVTLLSGCVAAAAGSTLGSLSARRVTRWPLRLWALTALQLLGLGLCLALHHGLTVHGSGLGADPHTSFARGEIWLFASLCFWVSQGLRVGALRLRALSLFEVAAAVLGVAQLVVAHRHGSIHRPYELADPLIARGDDPTMLFLALGGISAVLAALLLLDVRRLWRLLLQAAAIAALLLLTVGIAERFQLLPQPKTGGGLGLRGKQNTKTQPDKGGKGKHDKGKQGEERNNEELEFKDQYNKSKRRVPVGVVLLHDDYTPPSGVYYFRQGAFSQYNGRRLVAATLAGADADIATGFATRHEKVRQPPPQNGARQRLKTTVALLADHARPFALEAPLSFQPLSLPRQGRFRRAYRVHSVALSAPYLTLLGHKAGAADWNAALRAHYIEGPKDPRYRALASRIIAELLPVHLRRDPAAQAMAVSTWLSKNGTYSLRSKHAGAADPTAHFLFGNRRGYCVHFAHAATYLLRSLRLPTRVATGYAVEESVRQGGSSILISGQDSHAWPELYLEDVGWVVMDVTPEQVLDPPPPPPDPELQRLLGAMLRGQKPLPEPKDSPLRQFESGMQRLGHTLLLLLLALALGSILLGWLVKVYRRLAVRWGPASARARLGYRAALDQLSDVGLRRRPGEPPHAFAQRLASAHPAFETLTAAHLAARFGQHPSPNTARLRTLLRAARQQAQAGRSWWRRLGGMLHPWSWWWSK